VEDLNNVVDLQSSERLLDPDTRPKQFDELLEKYSVISIEVLYKSTEYESCLNANKIFDVSEVYSDKCKGKIGLD